MPLSTAEAAERLNVTERQVRRLIEAGELPATRFAGRHLLEPSDIDARARNRPERGRPLAARAAWGMLWELSGEPTPWLSSSERSRLRAWLRRAVPSKLALAARRRARVETYRALPKYLDTLVSSQGVVRGGVSAAADVGADIVAAGAAELYCLADVAERVVREYGLARSDNPNVTLRIPVLTNVLTDRNEDRVMPPGVIAADLLDSPDVRTRRAGGRLAADLLRRYQ